MATAAVFKSAAGCQAILCHAHIALLHGTEAVNEREGRLATGYVGM